MNCSAAALLQPTAEYCRRLDGPAAVDPVRSGHAYAHRIIRRDFLAHCIKDFEWKSHPVLERAAVFVLASVRQRRKELMQPIAMRCVQLNELYSNPDSASGRAHKGIADVGQVLARERDRRDLSEGKRHSASRSARLERFARRPAKKLRSSFTACVRELNTDRDGRMAPVLVDSGRALVRTMSHDGDSRLWRVAANPQCAPSIYAGYYSSSTQACADIGLCLPNPCTTF